MTHEKIKLIQLIGNSFIPFEEFDLSISRFR